MEKEDKEALMIILEEFGDSIDSQGSAQGDYNGAIAMILDVFNGRARDIINEHIRAEKEEEERIAKSDRDYRAEVERERREFNFRVKNLPDNVLDTIPFK